MKICLLPKEKIALWERFSAEVSKTCGRFIDGIVHFQAISYSFWGEIDVFCDKFDEIRVFDLGGSVGFDVN